MGIIVCSCTNLCMVIDRGESFTRLSGACAGLHFEFTLNDSARVEDKQCTALLPLNASNVQAHILQLLA